MVLIRHLYQGGDRNLVFPQGKEQISNIKTYRYEGHPANKNNKAAKYSNVI